MRGRRKACAARPQEERRHAPEGKVEAHCKPASGFSLIVSSGTATVSATSRRNAQQLLTPAGSMWTEAPLVLHVVIGQILSCTRILPRGEIGAGNATFRRGGNRCLAGPDVHARRNCNILNRKDESAVVFDFYGKDVWRCGGDAAAKDWEYNNLPLALLP
ncbi:hypothetical protein E2C01_035658 [Portunus trituberculatus]|uniref:Uncharacterized protein n=1 Tax=Portunus trituberculatus TaxID=210409 RepID=A0A5B7F8Y4_PORTR|nr:hypothetical protein [Portunus trituberculatus]